MGLGIGIASRLRESILASRGLRVDKSKRGQLTNRALLPVDITGCKSNLMLYIEVRHKDTIENLIWSDSTNKVAHRLEIPPRTITRWRKLFPQSNMSVNKVA